LPSRCGTSRSRGTALSNSLARIAYALALLVLGPLGSASERAPGVAPAVHVDNPWIRWLPAGVPAAGYLTLVNTGDASVTLMAADSPNFGSVTIHRSVAREGVMRMEEVKEIAVAPHSRVDFSAQGYHLMLMNPLQPIESAVQIPITLHFRDGTSLTVAFEVRKLAAGALSEVRSLVKYPLAPRSMVNGWAQTRRSLS
jgi:periplasmic copper chaperone A